VHLGDWSFGTLPDYVDLTRKNENKRVLHSIYPYLDVSAAKKWHQAFVFRCKGKFAGENTPSVLQKSVSPLQF